MPSRALVVAALSIAAVACYPDQIINSVQELASITTVVDTEPPQPLRSARTFALIDTIIHPARSLGSGLIGHDGDDEILARIRRRFIDDGWREITNVPAQRPDVVVLTTIFEQVNTGVFYGDWWSNWGYWPGWPTGYGADWGWGVPGVEFVYESGTLLITMLDIRNGDPLRKRVPVLWAAGIQGVVTTTALQGALVGIDQAFVQSPYLERP